MELSGTDLVNHYIEHVRKGLKEWQNHEIDEKDLVGKVKHVCERLLEAKSKDWIDEKEYKTGISLIEDYFKDSSIEKIDNIFRQYTQSILESNSPASLLRRNFNATDFQSKLHEPSETKVFDMAKSQTNSFINFLKIKSNEKNILKIFYELNNIDDLISNIEIFQNSYKNIIEELDKNIEINNIAEFKNWKILINLLEIELKRQKFLKDMSNKDIPFLLKMKCCIYEIFNPNNIDFRMVDFSKKQSQLYIELFDFLHQVKDEKYQAFFSDNVEINIQNFLNIFYNKNIFTDFGIKNEEEIQDENKIILLTLIYNIAIQLSNEHIKPISLPNLENLKKKLNRAIYLIKQRNPTNSPLKKHPIPNSEIEKHKKLIEMFSYQLTNFFKNLLLYEINSINFSINLFYKEKTIVNDIIFHYETDSHHKGQIPFECKLLNCESQEEKILFIKPRKAEIEIKILELFKNLNELEQKSINSMLPIYNIHAEGNFSVWDFIKGKRPVDLSQYLEKISPSVSEVIDCLSLIDKEKKILKSKLKRLEQICYQICLSDLHSENVILQNLISLRQSEKGKGKFQPFLEAGQTINVILIDLENIQQQFMGHFATGLYKYPIAIKDKLNRKEQELVFDFNLRANHIERRFVPILSQELISLLENPDRVDSISDAIVYRCKESGQKLECAQEDLKKYLRICIINGDVPYFFCKDGNVYFRSGQ